MIDVLIVEVVLSTANGLEIVPRFQPAFPDMQVLSISEQSAESLSAEGLLPKGAHFLREPFGAEDLIRKLQGLINRRRPREAGPCIAKSTARRASANTPGRHRRSS